MLKQIPTALIAMSVLTASSAFATENFCTPGKVAGSYIRERLDTGDGFSFIDQVTLGIDGTAYFYQSTGFDHLVTSTGPTGGSSIPKVGTWKCLDAYNVAMTVVSVNYSTVDVEYPASSGKFVPDTTPVSFDRLSVKWKIVDRNTLQRNLVAERLFALTDDPLSPNSVPFD